MDKTKSKAKYNFWKQDSVDEFLSFIPPLKRSLYSKVSKIIEDTESNHILDYGCGEGNQVLFLNKELNIDLYDININSAKSAYDRFKDDKVVKLVKSVSREQKNKYDLVIINMVWMCIPSENEIDSILGDINLVLKDTGKAVFSMTHPCFRDKNFSYYETDYSRNKKKYNYNREGEAFEVYIRNSNKTVFQDYHYSLQFIFKKMKEFNFNIDQLIELKDEGFKEKVNLNYPPYLIISVNK